MDEDDMVGGTASAWEDELSDLGWETADFTDEGVAPWGGIPASRTPGKGVDARRQIERRLERKELQARLMEVFDELRLSDRAQRRRRRTRHRPH